MSETAAPDDLEMGELVPLSDVFVAKDKERARTERRAKSAVARAIEARGLTPGRTDSTGTLPANAVDADEAMRWRGLLARNKQGEVRGTIGNTLQVLENDEQMNRVVVKDAFAAAYVWTRQPPFDLVGPFPREMRDSDVVFATRWIEQAHGVYAGADVVGRALAAVADANEVDALKAYLEGLEWDGKPRLDDWIVRLLGVENTPYARAVGCRFILSLVARGLMPGCKVDTILVLEGQQGKRKSSALRALVGEPWYTDSVPIHVEDKDAVIALGGKWLVEFGELDRFRRTDRSALKDFAARQVDRFRPPYGRATVAQPRRCCLTGSTNEDAYLDDATGARRFWPVRVVGAVRPEAIAKWRGQIFAEAVVALTAHRKAKRGTEAYERGQWWLTDAEEALRVTETDARHVSDPWERTLAEWAADAPYLTAHEALRRLNVDPSKTSKGDQMRLADVFRRLGFTERRQVRIVSVREWRYFRASPLSPPPDAVGDKKDSEIRAVTTDSTVTTKGPHMCAPARAVSQTGDDSGDSGDKPENTAVFVTQPNPDVVTNDDELVTAHPDATASTDAADDVFGPKGGGE